MGSRDRYMSQYGEQIHNGDVVFVPQGIGVVKWIGLLQFTGKPSTYVGIELADPRGDHDGIINGEEFFRCRQGHGVHVSLAEVIRKVEAEELLSKITILNTHIHTLAGKLRERETELKRLKKTQNNMNSFVRGMSGSGSAEPTQSREKHDHTHSSLELEEILTAAQNWDGGSGRITPLTPHSERSESKSSTVVLRSSEDEMMDVAFEPPYLTDTRPSETYQPAARQRPKISRKDGSPQPQPQNLGPNAQHPGPRHGPGRGVLQYFPQSPYQMVPGQHVTQYSDTYISDMSVSMPTHSNRTTADTLDMPTPQSDMMMTTPSYTPSQNYQYPSPSQMQPPSIPAQQVHYQPSPFQPPQHFQQSPPQQFVQHYGGVTQPVRVHARSGSHPLELSHASNALPQFQRKEKVEQSQIISMEIPPPPPPPNPTQQQRREKTRVLKSDRAFKRKAIKRGYSSSRVASSQGQPPPPLAVVSTAALRPEHQRQASTSDGRRSTKTSPMRQFVHNPSPQNPNPVYHTQVHQRQPSAASYPVVGHQHQQSMSSHESAQTYPPKSYEEIQDRRLRMAMETHHQRFGTTASLEEMGNMYRDNQAEPAQERHALPQNQHHAENTRGHASHDSYGSSGSGRPTKRIHLTSPLKVKVTATARSNTPASNRVAVVPQNQQSVLHAPRLAPSRGSVQEVAESPRRRQNDANPTSFYDPTMSHQNRLHGLGGVPPPYARPHPVSSRYSLPSRISPVLGPQSHQPQLQPHPQHGQTRSRPVSRQASPDPNSVDPKFIEAVQRAQAQQQQQQFSQFHLGVQTRPHVHSVPTMTTDTRPNGQFQQNHNQGVKKRVVPRAQSSKQVPNRPLPKTPPTASHLMAQQQEHMRMNPAVTVSQYGPVEQYHQYQHSQRPHGVAYTDPGQPIPIHHRKKRSQRELDAQQQLSLSKSSPLLHKQVSPGPVGNPMHPVTQYSPVVDENAHNNTNSRGRGTRRSRARDDSFLDPTTIYDDGAQTPDYSVRYENLSSVSEMDTRALLGQHPRLPVMTLSEGGRQTPTSRRKTKRKRPNRRTQSSIPESHPSTPSAPSSAQHSGRPSLLSDSYHEPNINYDSTMHFLPNINSQMHVRNDSSASTVRWYHSPQPSTSYTDYPRIVAADEDPTLDTRVATRGGHVINPSQDNFSDLESVEDFNIPTSFGSQPQRNASHKHGHLKTRQYQGRPLPLVEERSGAMGFLNSFRSPAKHDRDVSESVFTETTVQTDTNGGSGVYMPVMFQSGANSDTES